MYQRSYHDALNALIRNAPPKIARPLIARSLRELRRTVSVWSGRAGKRISGREWALNERAHMLFVNPSPWLKQ